MKQETALDKREENYTNSTLLWCFALMHEASDAMFRIVVVDFWRDTESGHDGIWNAFIARQNKRAKRRNDDDDDG